MTENIQKLLSLTDQFPTRKRVDYDSVEDREFVTEVLIALKNAAPDIRHAATLAPVSERLARIEEQVNDLWEEKFRLTSLRAAHVQSPNSDASPAQETAHNNRTPDQTPSTDDNAASSDRKSDSGNTSESSDARLNAARKAAARKGRPSLPAPLRRQGVKGGAAPQQQPPATPETGTA